MPGFCNKCQENLDQNSQCACDRKQDRGGVFWKDPPAKEPEGDSDPKEDDESPDNDEQDDGVTPEYRGPEEPSQTTLREISKPR